MWEVFSDTIFILLFDTPLPATMRMLLAVICQIKHDDLLRIGTKNQSNGI